MIAGDRGSQIAKSSAIVCDHIETLLRSFAILWSWSQTIADRRSQKGLRSSAIIWKHTSAIVCDRLRSCDRDRRRSQTIAEDRTMFYLLRSSAILCDRLRSYGNQPLANIISRPFSIRRLLNYRYQQLKVIIRCLQYMWYTSSPLMNAWVVGTLVLRR